jgi:hypothetical protein
LPVSPSGRLDWFFVHKPVFRKSASEITLSPDQPGTNPWASKLAGRTHIIRKKIILFMANEFEA